MTHVMLKFPNRKPRPYVKHAEGLYIFTEEGTRYLDASAGWTHLAVVGYGNPEVLDAMHSQMGRFMHMDYDLWRNRDHEELADILVSQAPTGLDMVYFCGSSGSEAVEAAIKLSFQVHFDQGERRKQWIISRDQSYHGATLQAMAISERDILDFYTPLHPEKRARVPQHNPSTMRKPGESVEAYALRSAEELEERILELGPENVCCFIAETQLGSLIGDVPPAPGYWKKVREICDKYDVHLILDEIYCGLGRSGKIYNCSWDDVSPDFICLGKGLAAGYAPLSAIVTRSTFQQIIAHGQGRIQHGHTHQGHALGTSAAIAVQKIIHRPGMMDHVLSISARMHQRLETALKNHPFFHELHGRGLGFSMAYRCHDRPAFSAAVQQRLETVHRIILSAKWHRVSFTPALVINEEQADQTVDAAIESFLHVAQDWPSAEEITS